MLGRYQRFGIIGRYDLRSMTGVGGVVGYYDGATGEELAGVPPADGGGQLCPYQEKTM